MTQQHQDRYIYPYAQGVKLDIRKADLKVYKKYPARTYGSIERAKQAAREYRDALLQDAGIKTIRDSSRHIRKRKGAQQSFQGKPLPVGMSIQYVRGKPMYLVVRVDDNTKRRFSIKALGEDHAYQSALNELKNLNR